MRAVSADKIREVVSDLCVRANFVLRQDALSQLKNAFTRETNKRARNILGVTIKNAEIARKEHIAICQDTGIPIVFLEIGKGVAIKGNLKQAVNKGVAEGYKRGYLRSSIVADPLLRGKPQYSPVVVHTDLIEGSKIKITVLPKGFGCENKTQLRMFNPTAKIEEIKKFIIDAVKSAGPDACPPYFLGIGIGGTADYACLLAKKALLKRFAQHPTPSTQRRKLANELLIEINKLNIGPMGLGGQASCLGVRIETAPTHIAGLPVCVNINCHVLRSSSAIL